MLLTPLLVLLDVELFIVLSTALALRSIEIAVEAVFALLGIALIEGVLVLLFIGHGHCRSRCHLLDGGFRRRFGSAFGGFQTLGRGLQGVVVLFFLFFALLAFAGLRGAFTHLMLYNNNDAYSS